MPKTTGFLIEADYEQQGSESVICGYFRTKTGLERFFFPQFKPYLFVANTGANTKERLISQKWSSEQVQVSRVEETQKSQKPMLKAYFKSTKDLVIAREELRKNGFAIFEFDIPFSKRFLIDSGLEPYAEYDIAYAEKNGQKNAQHVTLCDSAQVFEPKMAAFDIEAYSPGRFPTPDKDAILMFSLATPQGSTVYTTKPSPNAKGKVLVFATEKEMVAQFIKDLVALDLDILVTYNGDSFDIPYLTGRANALGLEARIGYGNSLATQKRRGLDEAAQLKGIQHLDAYQMINLLSRFGAVSLGKKDLESVVHELFGVPKKKITARQINEIWDSGDGMEDLILYNREDAEYTLRLASEYLPMMFELAKIVRFSLFDVCRASASQVVEGLLLIKAHETNALVPNKPDENEARTRLMQSVVGGYVKEPIPGLHENIAVLDFRSLYPSIIVGHNISPDSYKGIAPKGTTGENISPDGDWFAEQPQGFFVSIVKNLLELRGKYKDEYKKMDKKDPKARLLFGRQWALKIILNSFYGTTGFAQFRWYSRECARAITAFARHYVNNTIEEAEKAGFKVVYADTDSNFLVIPKNKTHEDVKAFVQKINKDLPEAMELEIEDFYKRGIFVTKKDAKGGAAKKRYALINYNDQLKIVGFEYVRRDWSMIAKKTQKDVLEALLKEGDPQKSVAIVRDAIARLKAGTVPKKELVVLTQIKRRLDKYDSIGPHVAAAQKAVERGREIEVGSVIGFIITKGNGKTISERAELEEYVKEGNYDDEYYITHQVVPAIIRILAELGYSEQDLLEGGKQATLF
ncbi:MAG: DNA-directed DNA polymerase [Candidatus Diapherotrites archaeon]|nr:DNA-directed DNA polymerase [Candidatus Diapherotrites archaeon]